MGVQVMRKTRKLAMWVTTLAVVPILMSPATAGPIVRIKNARQIYNDLTASLGVQGNSLQQANRIYRELESNLPERGVSSELTPALDSIYKLSSGVCELFARDTAGALSRNSGRMKDMTPEKAIAYVYALTLDRTPSAGELAAVKAVLDPTRSGFDIYVDAFYTSCLITSSSLEFLVVAQ